MNSSPRARNFDPEPGPVTTTSQPAQAVGSPGLAAVATAEAGGAWQGLLDATGRPVR